MHTDCLGQQDNLCIYAPDVKVCGLFPNTCLECAISTYNSITGEDKQVCNLELFCFLPGCSCIELCTEHIHTVSEINSTWLMKLNGFCFVNCLLYWTIIGVLIDASVSPW